MLSNTERRVLEIINSRLLITEKEFNSVMQKEQINGVDTTFQTLKDSGFIDRIESLGTCIVITQKGMRALQEK